MKVYRVILIDPKTHRIVPLNSSCGPDKIEALIGADTLDSFPFAEFPDGLDFGWVDDTGLSRGEPIHAFHLPTRKDPIAGKCLIVGADKWGRTTSARMPLDILRHEIEWLGRIKPEVTWDEVGNVKRSIITYARVKE